MEIKLNYHRFESFGTDIQWTNESPTIKFYVTYSKRRNGADMIYNVNVIVRSLSSTAHSTSKFGYNIKAEIKFDNNDSLTKWLTLKDGSPSHWTYDLSQSTGDCTISNKISGTTPLSVRLYSDNGSSRNVTYYFDLPVDPANFTTAPKLEVVEKTETSLTYKWTTPQTCSNIVWEGEGNKVATGVPGTTGTLTVTGLEAGKPYTHKGTFTRQDSGLPWSVSSTNETNKYPYVASASSNPFVIGDKVNLTLFNPHNRQITVYVKNGDEILFSTQTDGKTTGDFTIPASSLYSLIPDEMAGTLICYCQYGNIIGDEYELQFTYKGDEYPTFTTNNWSYSANLTELTHNDQVVINGYSDVTITIDTPAISEYGASIKGYSASWGKQGLLNDDGTITIVKGTGNSITCLAVDGRDLPSSTSDGTLALGDNYIGYTSPIIRRMDTTRKNGIYTDTYLNASGTFLATTFGSDGETNTLINPTYYVRENGQEEWQGPYLVDMDTVDIDTDKGTWSIRDASIHLNGQYDGFPINTSYNVTLIIADGLGLLGDASSISDVNDGKLARDVYKDRNGEYHEGINGLAESEYTQCIHGSININGTIYQNGEEFKGGPDVSQLVDIIYPVGSIYISANNTNPTTLFEGTTWEQIQGKFLLGAGTYTDSRNDTRTITGGQTGGTWAHKLTLSEMPSHKHDDNIATAAWGWRSGISGFIVGDGIDGYAWGSETTKGGDQAHNNIPPYIGVYIWERKS